MAPYPESLLRQLAEAYRRHASSTDIGAWYHVPRQTVIRAARKFGVPIRPQGSGPKITPATQRRILDLVRQGLRYADIAAQLGISKASVTSYTRQAGLSRSNGRPRTGTPTTGTRRRQKPLRRRCPVDGCYDITTNPVCRNGHVVYEELTDE